MTTAIGLLVISALGMLLALLQSFALSTLWRWFLSPQYGAGPSFAAWYGVAAIVGLLMAASLQRVTVTRDERPIADAIARCVGIGIITMFVLGFTWLTGQVFGWL